MIGLKNIEPLPFRVRGTRTTVAHASYEQVGRDCGLGTLGVRGCQSARKVDPGLECAPGAGQQVGRELTGAAGLSEDESHDQAPFP